jgi:hypothetical protein
MKNTELTAFATSAPTTSSAKRAPSASNFFSSLLKVGSLAAFPDVSAQIAPAASSAIARRGSAVNSSAATEPGSNSSVGSNSSSGSNSSATLARGKATAGDAPQTTTALTGRNAAPLICVRLPLTKSTVVKVRDSDDHARVCMCNTHGVQALAWIDGALIIATLDGKLRVFSQHEKAETVSVLHDAVLCEHTYLTHHCRN